MDKRIRYYIGLDTETCNSWVDEKGKLNLSNSLVYDLGWAITDKQGRVYKTRSFVITEVFFGMRDVMATAYYAKKIPRYLEDIKAGKRRVASFFEVWKIFKADLKEYGVTAVFAHNARFDLNSLNNTLRHLSGSKMRYFFPRDIELWDTLKMARQTIGKQPTYKSFCKRHGYMTKHKTPQVRLTAEVLYRYITGNTEFEESHTGLEDVLIEVTILKKCFRQHKKMDKALF